MERKPVIKFLESGYAVPYPEELFYEGILWLKDYRLNDFPKNVSGGFDEEVPYEEWLEDYLYNCRIELTEEQKKFSAYLESKDFSVIMLGFLAAFYESSQLFHSGCIFQEDFEADPGIDKLRSTFSDDPYQEYIEYLQSGSDIDPMPSRLEYALIEYGWFLMIKQEEYEFQTYWPAFVKLDPIHWLFGIRERNIELPDFAWRTYLSIMLKKIPDKETRLKLVHDFYDEYIDTIHK